MISSAVSSWWARILWRRCGSGRRSQLAWKTRLRVRYGETDAMGVAYYANYLTWFEVARNEFM